jgi:Bacterial PH domain
VSSRDGPAAPQGRAPTLVIHERASISVGVLGMYVFLILILVVVYVTRGGYPGAQYLFPFLVLLLLIYLARYVSTRYAVDDRTLVAWRLFGSRRMRLDRIRRIQSANLRRLGATGFVGTWGWRGRVWSPVVGFYQTVHTDSEGLLITGDGDPLFISPKDVPEFARELSRRVRSVSGGFEPDETPLA